jgi:hypothetical protein
LQAGVTDRFFKTITTLNPGITYSFKVKARNSVGSSLDSAVILILAAKEPDAPLNLQNVASITTAYQVGLSWNDGFYNGASPVIDYQVSYTESTSTTYTIFSNSITTKSTTVTGLTAGKTYKFIVQSRNIIGLSKESIAITILAA